MRTKNKINLTLDKRLIKTLKSNSDYTGESISHRVERLLIKDIEKELNK